MIESMETILVFFLLVYVIALIVDEVTYLVRGYRIVKYEPKRTTEIIYFNRRK